MTTDLDLARLDPWLAEHVEGYAGTDRIDKLPGGQSNPTYKLISGDRAFVLRRKPFGDILPSAHAVDREYRLISALEPTGFPVAAPHALCEDQEVIGAIFYVMGFVEGQSHTNGALPDMAPEARGRMYRRMIETLGQLHAVDYEAAGLGDYGRPGNYFERQIGRWTKQYRSAQTDDIEEVERLIDWLPETTPPQTRTSIIHGDYRIDNVMFGGADGTDVKAVIDWELSTLGDPMADLTYLLMHWRLPADGIGAGLMGANLQELGIPDLDEAAGIYATATGADVVEDLDWYFAYNLFRLVGILQGVKKRMVQGNASSDKASRVVAAIPMLANAAWMYAQKAGANT